MHENFLFFFFFIELVEQYLNFSPPTQSPRAGILSSIPAKGLSPNMLNHKNALKWGILKKKVKVIKIDLNFFSVCHIPATVIDIAIDRRLLKTWSEVTRGDVIVHHLDELEKAGHGQSDFDLF